MDNFITAGGIGVAFHNQLVDRALACDADECRVEVSQSAIRGEVIARLACNGVKKQITFKHGDLRLPMAEFSRRHIAPVFAGGVQQQPARKHRASNTAIKRPAESTCETTLRALDPAAVGVDPSTMQRV